MIKRGFWYPKRGLIFEIKRNNLQNNISNKCIYLTDIHFIKILWLK